MRQRPRARLRAQVHARLHAQVLARLHAQVLARLHAITNILLSNVPAKSSATTMNWNTSIVCVLQLLNEVVVAAGAILVASTRRWRLIHHTCAQYTNVPHPRFAEKREKCAYRRRHCENRLQIPPRMNVTNVTVFVLTLFAGYRHRVRSRERYLADGIFVSSIGPRTSRRQFAPTLDSVVDMKARFLNGMSVGVEFTNSPEPLTSELSSAGKLKMFLKPQGLGVDRKSSRCSVWKFIG